MKDVSDLPLPLNRTKDIYIYIQNRTAFCLVLYLMVEPCVSKLPQYWY